MNSPLSFTWYYDPFGIIYKLRVEHKETPYLHTQRPKIEKYMNQQNWVENTLQEAEEQVISRTTSETPIPREKSEKWPREEESPTIIELSAKEFNIYANNIKTSSKIDFPLLQEAQGTIVLSSLQTLKFDSSTTNSPSSSTTK